MQPIPLGLPEAPQQSYSKFDSPTHAIPRGPQQYNVRGYLRAQSVDSPPSSPCTQRLCHPSRSRQLQRVRHSQTPHLEPVFREPV